MATLPDGCTGYHESGRRTFVTGLFLPHFYRVKTKPFEHCDFSGLSMDSERAPWTRCVLFSIAIRFPKLDVAGSIPVSRVSDRTDLLPGRHGIERRPSPSRFCHSTTGYTNQLPTAFPVGIHRPGT